MMPLAVGVALLVGVLSTVVAQVLIFVIGLAIDSDMFRSVEMFRRILGGLIWHPIITVVASLLWRRGLAPA